MTQSLVINKFINIFAMHKVFKYQVRQNMIRFKMEFQRHNNIIIVMPLMMHQKPTDRRWGIPGTVNDNCAWEQESAIFI
jgi:hypothetical protein